MSCSSYWSSRRLIDRVIGQSVLVGIRSPASSREASVALAFSRRRWGLAVTCACVVRRCACVLAPPMVVGRDVRLRRPLLCLRACAADGGHPIGRIAPDQLGLNLPDRVFRLIGHKRRLGAGRLSSPCHCRRLPTGVYRRPPGGPAPVRERDTRGNGGGFAPLEASPRRVAGVSRP